MQNECDSMHMVPIHEYKVHLAPNSIILELDLRSKSGQDQSHHICKPIGFIAYVSTQGSKPTPRVQSPHVCMCNSTQHMQIKILHKS